MAKKRISSPDLIWIISEEMRQADKKWRGVSVAVIPKPRGGWELIVGPSARRTLAPRAARRLEAMQKRLQNEYVLEA